jgi:hypothetical protein
VHATIASCCGYAIYSGTANGAELELLAACPGSCGDDGTIAPQSYRFEIEDQRYIYVAVCGDECGTNGLLAEFLFNDLAVLSGDPAWEVVPASCEIGRDALRLTTADVTRQVHRANGQSAWQRAAAMSRNTRVGEISPDAAWMWLPRQPLTVTPDGGLDAATGACCVLFRISPGQIWPEIELWHGRNAGWGSAGAWGYSGGGSNYFWGGGSGGGGGHGGGGLANAHGGYAPPITDPFPTTAPPNSRSIPITPTFTPPESYPGMPPPSHTPVDNPPAEPPDTYVGPPDQEGRTKPPVTPPVPEPASALLLLVCAAWGLRCR